MQLRIADENTSIIIEDELTMITLSGRDTE